MKQTVNKTSLDSMLTTRQVADFLQVSICTVRRWSDKGMLKFYRVGSRGDRRYQSEDVLRFLDESTSSSYSDVEGIKVPVGTRVNEHITSRRDAEHGRKKQNRTQ